MHLILGYFPALIECLKFMLKHAFQLSLIITIEKHENYLNTKAKPKPKLSVLKSQNRNRNRETDF